MILDLDRCPANYTLVVAWATRNLTGGNPKAEVAQISSEVGTIPIGSNEVVSERPGYPLPLSGAIYLECAGYRLLWRAIYL